MQSTDEKTCLFSGCMRVIHARGLCNSHYAQQRSGEQLVPIRSLVNGQLSARMAAYTDRSGDCWLWTGGRTELGYGRIAVNGGMKLAHRVSYELERGPIPADMMIDHRCHQPACVRPDHLQVADPRENAENRAGVTRANQSGIRGVYRLPGRDKWVVKVGHAGKLRHGGTYASLDAAEAAALALRMELHTNNLADQVTASGLSSTTI